MAGFEVMEEVHVARSAREHRLRLSRKIGGDYDAVALAVLAAALAASMDLATYRAGTIGPAPALLLLASPICALWLAWRLLKATIRSYDLVRIATGTIDSDTTRAALTNAAEKLGWEENRNNSEFGRYFLDRYVLTVLFRRDHVLLNCRRMYRNRMRWPIGAAERDEVIRRLSDTVMSAVEPSNPR